MLGGLSALFLFLLFLVEWPQFMRELEARSNQSDPLEAAIRLARIRAGLTPEADHDNDDKELRHDKYLRNVRHRSQD